MAATYITQGNAASSRLRNVANVGAGISWVLGLGGVLGMATPPVQAVLPASIQNLGPYLALGLFASGLMCAGTAAYLTARR